MLMSFFRMAILTFLGALFMVTNAHGIMLEDSFLGAPSQLTTNERFAKAGEAYFSPDGSKVIFQAVEQVGEGGVIDEFYGMYLADLVFSEGRPELRNVRRISPPGSANTCGWFDPIDSNIIWFASTVEPPREEDDAPGYQRSGRYKWMFPPQMRVVKFDLRHGNPTSENLEVVAGDGTSYVAECSISPDGRYLLYCTLSTGQGDLFVRDLKNGKDIPLITVPGYDGGPFFSPDGKRICYRSDRHNNNYLQLFVADLRFNEDGEIIGVEREHQVTDNRHVNWAPFWHPDGRHLVYATSQMGHGNYEIFIVDALSEPDMVPPRDRYGTATRRITAFDGADVLPVFDSEGKYMMWTSQQDASGTSQLWIAPFTLDPRMQSERASTER
jgi:TolB protein